MENMESVSSMKSLGAMDFYDEEDNKTAFLAVRITEEVELESNQIKVDDINNMHDCQQDPDNMQVNELQLFMGKEEEEEDGGNASKVDEGGKTVSVYVDADDMKDEETSPSNMDVRNKNELCTSGVIRMSNLKIGKVYVKHSKEDGGNSSKINEKTKIWSDIPSNEDKDIISKKDGVPEQAQRITGPVCNDIPEKQQDSHNLPSNINSMKRKETVNDKQAGEEEEKGGGNTTKMEEVFKTSIECEDSDAANTPKTDGATENSKEERQDVVNTSDVNDKQAGEEEEKGGGNTPKMEEDFKTSTDHNGECDSEQDADNSPSWWNVTNIWQFFSWGFWQILLIGILTPVVAFANPASNPHKYAVDPGSTQLEGILSCEHYLSELYNHSRPFKDRNACIEEQKNIQCEPRLESMCILYINQDVFYAGCGKRGLLMNGTECPMVTHQNQTNKYIVQCYQNECPQCTDSDSPEQRLSKCRDLQNKKSSSTRKEPYLWIMVFMAAVFTLREYL